jgi:hypothetical protein
MPQSDAKKRVSRPFTLRLTLAFLVLAATAYVAAISIYIAVQIAPTATALQNFRQETTVRHDSSERLLLLDTALRDTRALTGNTAAPPESLGSKIADLRGTVRQLVEHPDDRSGLSTVAQMTFPAGKYTLRPLDIDPNVVEISDGKTTKRLVVEPAGAPSRDLRIKSDDEVVFKKRGDQYVLSKIWDAAEQAGVEPISSADHDTHQRHHHHAVSVFSADGKC